MGIFGSLLGNKAKEAMNQFSGNKDFLEGLCAASGLVAAAEGGVSDEEFDMAMQVMLSKEAITSGFKATEVETTLGRMIKKTGTRSGKAELKQEIRDVVERDKTGGLGKAIFLAALDVADSGGIDAAEEKVLREIADLVGVNYDKEVA